LYATDVYGRVMLNRSQRNSVNERGLDLRDSRCSPILDFCVHGKERFGSMKRVNFLIK